jgi:hypothetical protein
VNPSLYRKKDRIEKGLPSFENAFQVRADRFDKKRHDHNKEPSLNSSCAHVTFCESNTDATGEKPLRRQQHLANKKKIVLL